MTNQSQRNQRHGCSTLRILEALSLLDRSVQAMHHRTSQSSLCRIAIKYMDVNEHHIRSLQTKENLVYFCCSSPPNTIRLLTFQSQLPIFLCLVHASLPRFPFLF